MARVRRTRNVENLSGLLDRIAAETSAPDGAGAKETVRVGDLLNAIGRRAYGPLLLAIGLFSISPATIVPGLTWASAVLTFVVAAQLALGLKRPWMPRRVLAIAVPRAPLDGAIRRARPWAARIDKIVRPRFVVLADPPWVNMAGLLAMAAAVVTIPLGFIPFAPLVPGLAIVLLGLGVTARDGLLLSYGAAAMVGAGWLVWREAPALAGFLAGLWPGRRTSAPETPRARRCLRRARRYAANPCDRGSLIGRRGTRRNRRAPSGLPR